MESIVFLDRGTFEAAMRPPAFEHEWKNFETTAAADARTRLASATIAVVNKVALRAETLEALPKLKFIALTATGFDNVDAAYCKGRGIGVANVPAYADVAVPEHAMMLMLALRRNLPAYQAAVAGGRWQTSALPNLPAFSVEDLAGSILGLIGYGRLAQALEKLALDFGMKILVSERKGATSIRVGRNAFDDVLIHSDVLSIHTPLTAETRGLIGAAELARMKKTAILINTARGGVVDETALAEALRSGMLGGAGLDVLSQEPPRDGNPLLDLKLPNLIVTPHVAWMSRQAQARLAEEVILNIEAFHQGKQRNRIA